MKSSALLHAGLFVECLARRRIMACLMLALMNFRKVGTSLKFFSMFSARISMALSTSKIVFPFALVVVAESRSSEISSMNVPLRTSTNPSYL